MRNDSMNVYERPEVEEVELTIESSIFFISTENPGCPTKTIDPWGSDGEEEDS